MDKNLILEVLNDWNFWKKELDIGKSRDKYLDLCLRYLKVNVITSVVGVRRSGKSYVLRQTAQRLIENNKDKKNILMINFEDRRFTDFYQEILDEIYNLYLETIKPDKTPFIFLDEVQNIPNWERWVRTMHELGKAKIIVSGSSAKLLSGELATVLTGRHLDIFIFPLDLKEVLDFKGIRINDKLDLISKKTELKIILNEYIEFGGFPEVVLSSEKKQLLLTYFDDIITKDIEKRYNIRETKKFRSLTRLYLTYISNTITFNSLSKNLELSTATIEKFSQYLEEVNLIFFLKRFSFKIKEQEKAARKIYSIDCGIPNAVGFQFSANIGRIAENIVAIELKKKEKLNSNIELYYWQDVKGKEVDFVIKNKTQIEQLVQVCWNINDNKTKHREIYSLLKASQELKCKNLLIITEDYEGEETHEWFGMKGKIKFISLLNWLLQ